MAGTRKYQAVFEGVQPRYLAVAEALAHAINSGRYPVGSLLPTEGQFCATFGVSRHTIRESLRKLRDLGLVSRHHGVGTRVESAEMTGRYVASLGSIQDVWRHLLDTTPTLVAKAVERQHQASFALPSIGGGEIWQRADILRTRVAGSGIVPISIARIYVNNAFRRVVAQIKGATVPVISLIEQEYGQKVTSIHQEISALTLDTETARLLQAGSNVPGLAIRRVFRGHGDVILQVSRTVSPADRFVYGLELRMKPGL